jgi:hypothetical protein
MTTTTQLYICLMTFAASQLRADGFFSGNLSIVGNVMTVLSYTSLALWINMVAVGAHTVWTGGSVPWIYQLHVFLIIAIVPIIKLLQIVSTVENRDFPDVTVALSYAPIILLNLVALPLVLLWGTNTNPRACLTIETSSA